MNQPNTQWNAKFYNQKHSFVFNYGESLLELLQPQSNERILDLGCGSGELTAKIRPLAGEIVGMDFSPEMIKEAKLKFDGIDFLVGDASNFNFNKKFDAIFSNAALHWVLDYREAIRCMYENLNLGGRLIAELGGKGNIQSIIHELRKSLKKRGYTTQSELQLWYFPSLGTYSTALENAGFTVRTAEYYSRPTALADEQTGIADWLTMFGSSFFEEVSEEDTNEIKEEVQIALKPTLFTNGKWYADYKRLRVVAFK